MQPATSDGCKLHGCCHHVRPELARIGGGARGGVGVRVWTEIGLPVPPALAWVTLTDWERQATWMRDADSVLVEPGRRSGVGTRLAVRTRVLGLPVFTERLDVVVWEPPTRLVVAHRSFVHGTGEWALEPAGAGSRFRWTEDLSIARSALGRPALAAYRPFMRRLMQRSAINLRREIERGP
jgi:Polyketide cyclase / dehydrase and lipid transport